MTNDTAEDLATVSPPGSDLPFGGTPFGIGLRDERPDSSLGATGLEVEQPGVDDVAPVEAEGEAPRGRQRRVVSAEREPADASAGFSEPETVEDVVADSSTDASPGTPESADGTESSDEQPTPDGRVRRRRASISSRLARGRGAAKKADPEAGDRCEELVASEEDDCAEKPAASEEAVGTGATEPDGAPESPPDRTKDTQGASDDGGLPRDDDETDGDSEFVDEVPGGQESAREEPRGRRSRGRRRRGRGRQAEKTQGAEGPDQPAEPDRPDRTDGMGEVSASESAKAARSPERRGQVRSKRERAPRERGTDAGGDSRRKPADSDAVELPTWVEPLGEGPDLFKASRRQRRDLMTAGGETATTEPGASEDAGAQEQSRAGRRGSFKRILVNADDPEEVRIAVAADGRLEELYYDRPGEKRYLGNIYKGRVVNLEPAIQAAFVDIGIGRNGFLHVSDVLPAYKDSDAIPIDSLSQRLADRRRLRLQEILREGQEVLVQISKDAIGAKGPSLTTYVSVPGKFLVLMPGVSRHGVSKRIQDDEDRHDLRKELANLNPPKGMGYIVRTAGHGCSREDFDKDFRYLMRVWEELTAKVKKKRVPTLCYAESDLVIRTMRDLFGPDVDEILVDDPAVYERAKGFCEEVMTEANPRLKLYSGVTPIFTRFGIEEEIEKIYNRKVPLPSGGHIVVEQTEALVAIDVNSGKYRDEEDLEATALKTNLEAADVIARELRLRDFGGIIINDFIDMERESNRREVERAFRRALKGERAKCWVSRISRFGIIEMTRQRVRPSFERDHYEPCRCCRGTGVVKTARSTGMAILRQARAGLALKRKKTCEIAAHPEVVSYLLNDRRAFLTELEERYRKTVNVITSPDFSLDQFVVRYF